MTTGKTVTEELSMSLTPVRLYLLVPELHSYNATPDDYANFLAKDVSLHSRVRFLSNPRGLWKTSGKSLQYIWSLTLPCCEGQLWSGSRILQFSEFTSKLTYTGGTHTLFLTSPLLYFILATESFTENEYVVTRLLSFCDKSEELSVSSCVK